MSTITTRDGTEIHDMDWGEGPGTAVPAAPHGISPAHQDHVNADMLAVSQS